MVEVGKKEPTSAAATCGLAHRRGIKTPVGAENVGVSSRRARPIRVATRTA